MHPSKYRAGNSQVSFPRRRGDAPDVATRILPSAGFPPQARGCTVPADGQGWDSRVSPAGAGMHPGGSVRYRSSASFPRRRGDAPQRLLDPGLTPQFPPQARGCTDGGFATMPRTPVSPAGAGMHRMYPAADTSDSSFPRRRGDAPRTARRPPSSVGFPPQARGCTVVPPCLLPGRVVSPAGAGMHLDGVRGEPVGSGFPRRRGDAPSLPVASATSPKFPPQARGCTGGKREALEALSVSPAGAGMHRNKVAAVAAGCCFPRRRGDAPRTETSAASSSRFPPQARGCTPAPERPLPAPEVSPRRRGDAPFSRLFPTVRVGFPPQARGCTVEGRGALS